MVATEARTTSSETQIRRDNYPVLRQITQRNIFDDGSQILTEYGRRVSQGVHLHGILSDPKIGEVRETFATGLQTIAQELGVEASDEVGWTLIGRKLRVARMTRERTLRELYPVADGKVEVNSTAGSIVALEESDIKNIPTQTEPVRTQHSHIQGILFDKNAF